MKAKEIYETLEKDFIKPGMSDDWAQSIEGISEYVTDNFKNRSMGLVCDFASEINKVYTAVFPSNKVMKKIIEDNVQDAMLFVHHPATWDIRKAPNVFEEMDRALLQEFKERRISIYNLHVPLDNYGEFSTTVTLAKAIGITPEKTFAPYYGAMCGVIGTTNHETVTSLKQSYEGALGHEASTYKYGTEEIKDNKVAVVAGGGNEKEILEEIAKEGINTFITGITAKNQHSKEAHEYAEKHRINILGGTHYSTEKFACMKMTEYFKNLGVTSEFIPDDPIMEDL